MTIALGIFAASLAADAQPPAKMPRIGWLGTKPIPEALHLLEVFRQGLWKLGYVEGQNIAMEYRWSEGKDDRLPDLATDIVRLKVDVIVATRGTPTVLAAKNATRTIPIVMLDVADPVRAGLVASLARPGRNITGLSILAPELSGKRLKLVKEAIPAVTRVAVLMNLANPAVAPLLRETEIAAHTLGLQLQSLEVRDPIEIESAFDAMTSDHAEALIVLPSAIFLDHHTRIVELATKSRLPTMFWRRELAEAGGLIAYGPSLSDMYRRAATYVDKILKGAKPADLPVEQPMRFELVINLKTAQALGLTIPPMLLFRADEVIK